MYIVCDCVFACSHPDQNPPLHLATTLEQAGHLWVTSLESEQSGSGAHSHSPTAHSSPASSQADMLVSEVVIVTI